MEFYKIKKAEIGIDLNSGDATVDITNIARFDNESDCDTYIDLANNKLRKDKVIGVKYYKKPIQCDDDCDVYISEMNEEEVVDG